MFRSIEKSNKHKILKAKNWVAFKIEEEIKHKKINIGNIIMPCCEERLVTKPCRLGMQKNVNSYVYVWYKTNFRLRFPSLIITAHINQNYVPMSNVKDKQMYRMSFICRSQFMDLGEIEEATWKIQDQIASQRTYMYMHVASPTLADPRLL